MLLYSWTLENVWNNYIRSSIAFLHNSKFPANSWQDPARIDIQWVANIECQYWQDPARNWQEFTNYAKHRLAASCLTFISSSDDRLQSLTM